VTKQKISVSCFDTSQKTGEFQDNRSSSRQTSSKLVEIADCKVLSVGKIQISSLRPDKKADIQYEKKSET
jgi:hypothetical protein